MRKARKDLKGVRVGEEEWYGDPGRVVGYVLTRGGGDDRGSAIQQISSSNKGCGM